GSFSIGGVVPGAFPVQFFGGCGNGDSVAPQYYDGQPTSVSAKPVKFIPGKFTTHISPVMQPGGTVAGTLTGPRGTRLSKVCAGAQAVNQPNQSNLGGLAGVFVTSQGGHYELRNLAPGSYQLSFGGKLDTDLGCIANQYAVQSFKSQPDPTAQDN